MNLKTIGVPKFRAIYAGYDFSQIAAPRVLQKKNYEFYEILLT